MDKPREVRKESRVNRKSQKSEQPFHVNKWFGVLPFGIALMLKKKRAKKLG